MLLQNQYIRKCIKAFQNALWVLDERQHLFDGRAFTLVIYIYSTNPETWGSGAQ